MNAELKTGTRLGKYELLLCIGRGGMASVWVARMLTERPEEDRLVAVKVMLSDLDAAEGDFVSMFIDEVRLVGAIRHPNVVKIYEAGQQGGLMFMAMEWVEGESLQAFMQEAGKRKPIPAEMAVRIISDAAAGLHAAHELTDAEGRPRGVVHRDISPHNLLVSVQGVVKLVDFGIAKAVGRVSENTQIGQLKGKFAYMSPEQARGKPVDRRSDIFALGIVLYELTTNRRLFRGKNEIDTLRLVLTCTVPRPSSVVPGYPRELERILLKALAPTPEMRYQSAEEFRRDLESYLKADRVVVTASGVAGLLKRVLGERIEARRAAARAALIELGGARRVAPSLIPDDPAFTPTGPRAPGRPGEGETLHTTRPSLPRWLPSGVALALARRGVPPARAELLAVAAVILVGVVVLGALLSGSTAPAAGSSAPTPSSLSGPASHGLK
jgi:hypothetical protein